MDKKVSKKMGSTQKAELTPEQKVMREELAEEFKDVNVDITLEDAPTASDPVDNDPPIQPPVEKDETDFKKFVEKARAIIMGKCPDATDVERGRYFTHAVGQNLNQVWATPGGQANALRMLRECKDPVRTAEVHPNPQPVQTKPTAPARKPARQAPAPLDLGYAPAIQIDAIQTLTGVPFLAIQSALDTPLPNAAYSKLTQGVMAGGTDIDPIYVRQRLDEVFGPHGIGWKIDPGVGARTVHEREQRTNKDGEVRTWFTCKMENYVFKYIVIDEMGMRWIETSQISDWADNTDSGYAYRSVFSSLMKQAFKNMGGFNHIYMGYFTYENAKG